MKLHVKRIVIWPDDSSNDRRDIFFEPGVVNVLPGYSRTGKSALLSIIDYCLGSGKCRIPAGPIREKSDWFGVLFESGDNEELLLARKEPGERESTSTMLYDRGTNLLIPDTPNSNIGLSEVKDRLDQLAGLTTLSFKGGESDSGFDSRPSFRDLTAFNFLPQHIVANPNVLFYKADTYEHRETLKRVLPYALGIVDPEMLMLKKEIADTRSELNNLRDQKQSREKAAEAWTSELQSEYSRAKELGLLEDDAPGQPSELEQSLLLEYLRTVPKK